MGHLPRLIVPCFEGNAFDDLKGLFFHFKPVLKMKVYKNLNFISLFTKLVEALSCFFRSKKYSIDK